MPAKKPPATPSAPAPAPAAWRAESSGLHMRSAPGAAGRLVLLADVVHWLAQTRELPLSAAVQSVAHTLETQGAKLPLFRAQPGDYAQPCTSGNVLGSCRLIQKAQTVLRRPSWASDWQGDRPAVPVPVPEKWATPTPPGPESAAQKAARFILENWPRTVHARPPGAAPGAPAQAQPFMGGPSDKAAALCVRLSDAVAFWGYSMAAELAPEIRTFADLIAHRKANPRAPWEPAHRAILAAEVQARGGRGAAGVAAGVAAELGIEPARLNKVLSSGDQAGDEGPTHTERRPAPGRVENAFESVLRKRRY
ncbi:hypothetical protein [Extensimonas perlucida]|uniref:hypothetical protein n=1 Tax=Extensimonas perlucida TaxID=2590786 RepID=UPI00119E6722|nr:hypothetical protein [Extensimonas perlucida]